jgi:hypothetical protein
METSGKSFSCGNTSYLMTGPFFRSGGRRMAAVQVCRKRKGTQQRTMGATRGDRTAADIAGKDGSA